MGESLSMNWLSCNSSQQVRPFCHAKQKTKENRQELRLSKIDLTWNRGYREVVKTNTQRKKAQGPFLY